jgi:hypothetical protein
VQNLNAESGRGGAEQPGQQDIGKFANPLRHGLRVGLLAHAQCQRRWLRLLMWESLDVGEGTVHAEAVRVASSRHIAEEFAGLQESDVVDKRLEPRFLALAFIALCIFPFVLPQMARMLTGEAPSSAGFQERYARVVSEIVRRLAPGR